MDWTILSAVATIFAAIATIVGAWFVIQNQKKREAAIVASIAFVFLLGAGFLTMKLMSDPTEAQRLLPTPTLTPMITPTATHMPPTPTLETQASMPVTSSTATSAPPSLVPTATPTPTATLVPPTGTPLPPPISSLIPTSSPTPMLTPASVVDLWCDDFNDGIIDETKWLPPSTSLMYERDGALNMSVSAQESWGRGDKMIALPQGRQVKGVDATITIKSYVQNYQSGGAGLYFVLQDGRDFTVNLGPGPNETPGFEFSLCPTTSSRYEECDNRSGPNGSSGKVYLMEVVWTGDEIQFFIDKKLITVFAVQQIPITEWHLGMYADEGSVFHAAVDDVCVTYMSR